MRMKIFRWRAVGVLVLLLIALGIVWILFSDLILRQTTEEASTQALGTEVDLASFRLLETQARVDMGGLQVADPFDRNRNLLEANRVALKLNPVALAEKKLVIENFSLEGMRFGTTRQRPAAPASGKGFAPQLLREVRDWARNFDVPLLQLTAPDNIKQLVLDPTQLGTIKAVSAAARRTDSTRQALEAGFKNLQFEATYDSAQSLADRVSKLNPRQISPVALADTVQSVRNQVKAIESLRARIQALDDNAHAALGLVSQSIDEIDAARRRDYDFAKGLLKLPSIAAPDLGGAFFGKVSIQRFQELRYWVELARQYMPPGLLPRAETGPKRLRASGTTVHFRKQEEYPRLLLQSGNIDFTIGGENLATGKYRALVQGLTTEPALYGRPLTFAASRTAAAKGPATFDVRGVLNHLEDPPHDSVLASLSDIGLPKFDLPGLPFQVDPRRGNSRLAFALKGDRISASWSVSSDQVAWARDPTHRLNTLEDLVWRVLSGLGSLQVNARLTGTLSKPNLSVRSNLDEAVAARLRSVLGEEVAKAEARVRAEVDRLVADQIGPVKERAAGLRADVDTRIADQRRRLDEVQRRLEAELKRLAGPAGGLLPKLPRLP